MSKLRIQVPLSDIQYAYVRRTVDCEGMSDDEIDEMGKDIAGRMVKTYKAKSKTSQQQQPKPQSIQTKGGGYRGGGEITYCGLQGKGTKVAWTDDADGKEYSALFFGLVGTAINQFLSKGDQIQVEGDLKINGKYNNIYSAKLLSPSMDNMVPRENETRCPDEDEPDVPF